MARIDPRVAAATASVNAELQARAIRRAVYFEGLKAHEVEQVVEFLDGQVVPDLLDQLKRRLEKIEERGYDLGPKSTQRLRELIAANNQILRAGMAKAGGMVKTSMMNAAVSEAEARASHLAAALPIDIETKIPSLGILKQAALGTPIHGKPLEKWFGKLAADTGAAVDAQVRAGIAAGESVDQIVRRIKLDPTAASAFAGASSVAAMNRNVRAVTRTAMNHAAARAAEEAAIANGDLVKSIQIVATLDVRTTEICIDMDGKTFPVGQGPRPPFHFACRTVIAFITKSWKELGLTKEQQAQVPREDLERMDGAQSPAPSLREIVDSAEPDFQDEILGSKLKGDLLRAGRLDGVPLSSPPGVRQTLEQVDAKDESFTAFLKVKELTEPEKAELAADLIAQHAAATDPKTKKALTNKLWYLDKDWKVKWAQPGSKVAGAAAPPLPPPIPSPAVLPTAPAAQALALGHPPEKLEKIRAMLLQMKDPATDAKKRKSLRSQLWVIDKDWKQKFDNPEFLGAQAGTPSVSTAAAAVPKPAPTPTIAPPAGAVSAQDTQQLIVADVMLKVGDSPGSNPGAFYADKVTTTKWLIKTPKSAELARNEVLASKLYQLAGIDVADVRHATNGGKASVASKVIPNLEKLSLTSKTSLEIAREGFATDAWLANWDAVGLQMDNLLENKASGKVFRIDVGGALEYRAQGSPKGAMFGDKVGEIDSLRNPSINAQAAKVFGGMGEDEIAESIDRVLAIKDEHIRDVVQRFGPEDPAANAALVNRLLARKADLALRRAQFVSQAEAAAKAKAAAAEAEKLAKAKAVAAGIEPPTGKAKKLMLELKAAVDSKLDSSEIYSELADLGHSELADKMVGEGFVPQWIVEAEAKATKAALAKASLEEAAKLKEQRALDAAKASAITPEARAAWFDRPSHAYGTEEWLKAQKGWVAGILPDERRALGHWSGSGYVNMRKLQFSGTLGSESTSAEYRAKLNDMDLAMARAPRFEGTTWRGVKLKPDDVEKWTQVGSVIEYNAHSSHSRTKRIADSFASSDGETRKVVFEVKTKSGVDIQALSTHKHEDEILLRRGARFRIVEVVAEDDPSWKHKGYKQYLVRMEEIAPEDPDFVRDLSGGVVGAAKDAAAAADPNAAKAAASALAVGVESPAVTQKGAAGVLSFVESNPGHFTSFADGNEKLGTILADAIPNNLGFQGGWTTPAQFKAVKTSLATLSSFGEAAKLDLLSFEELADDVVAKTVISKSGLATDAKVVLNSKKFSDLAMELALELQHEQGWTAGGTVEYAVAHEFAHVIESKATGALADAIAEIKKQVNPAGISGYAKANPAETWSETFGALMTKKYIQIVGKPELEKAAKLLAVGMKSAGLTPPPPLSEFLP